MSARIAGRLVALFVLAGLVVASPGLADPSPPPDGDRTSLRVGSGESATVLHPRLDGDGWCPTGEDLDDYLEALALAPIRRSLDGTVRLAADPVVRSIDGILLIEDAGAILRRDRVFDLPLESIELIPAGDGYQVIAVPPAYEPLGAKDKVVFVGQDTWTSAPVVLDRFTFPFGGIERDRLWVTPTNLLAFEPPTAPVKIGLCSEGCFLDEGQILHDRLPRISPLHHGTSFYGWNAFAREERDRLVVTWQYADPANLDVQAILFSDGRIRFNYAAVSGIPWGAVVVVTGNDPFWSDLRLGGDATDPEGDVAIPSPDGPAMDIVAVSVRQVGTSELLRIEVTLAAPPPPDHEERILYRIDLADEADGAGRVGGVVLQWQNGQFYWATEPVVVDGNTLRLHVPVFDLPLTHGSITLDVSTSRGSQPYEDGDHVRVSAVFQPPAGPMMLDLTSDLPVTLGDRPVYEAFTLPSLQTGEVLRVGAPLFEDAETIEAFPIFQNLWTDIIFFAGGYHAGGNSGADGTGFGSSELPRSPSLLHLNSIDNYGAEDGAMLVMSHEFGHRWLYHFAIEENGQPSRSLNPAGGHPAGWVHTPAVRPVYFPLDYSVMGGSNWRDNGDGTFTSPPEDQGGANGFSWHELYLMGLADPAEVADWWYIADALPPLPNAYWAPNDTTVLGTRVPVDVHQIIAIEGPRVPAYPDALRDFLAPIVLVSRPGAFDQDDIDTVKSLCTIWQSRFAEATDWRASVRCFFDPPVVTIETPPSDVTVVPGDTVEFAGSATDGDGDPVELRWDFSDVAPETTGPGPHPVTFGSTGVYPVRLSGVDGTGMVSLEPDAVTVSVECPTVPPDGVVDSLRIGKEGDDLRFTWADLPDAGLDYVVLMGQTAEGPFYPQGSAASGDPGLVLARPDGTVVFKVATRNADGCLGPY